MMHLREQVVYAGDVQLHRFTEASCARGHTHRWDWPGEPDHDQVMWWLRCHEGCQPRWWQRKVQKGILGTLALFGCWVAFWFLAGAIISQHTSHIGLFLILAMWPPLASMIYGSLRHTLSRWELKK